MPAEETHLTKQRIYGTLTRSESRHHGLFKENLSHHAFIFVIQ